MIKRPALWMLTAFLAGCLAGRSRPGSPALLNVFFLLLSISLILCLILFRFRQISAVFPKIISLLRTDGFLLLLPALFVLGIVLTGRQLSGSEMNLGGHVGKRLVAEGAVSRIDQKKDRQTIYLKNARVWDEQEKKEYYLGKLLLYGKIEGELLPGNRIRAEGSLAEFEKPGNPGQFDEAFYYGSLGLACKMYAKSITVTDPSYSPLHKGLRDIRRALQRVYERLFDEKDAGIIKAMVLGEKNGLDSELKELYQKNGIAHILAISGLHISFIGMFFFHLMKRAGVPKLAASPVTIFLILAYGIMTDFSVSTNRAVVMLILALAAGMIGRTYDMITAACVGAFLILAWQPLQLYQGGFLLSFGAIAAIAVVHPVLEEEFIKSAMKKKWYAKLLQSFLLSLSIQLVTMPVLLFFYYEIPLYSVLLNLIILPLVSLLLILALASGILGSLFLPAGAFPAGGAHGVLVFYEWLCGIFGSLPGSRRIAGRPPEGSLLVYYALLSLFLLYLHKRKKEELHPGRLVFSAAAVMLLLPLLLLATPQSRQLRITFLDVGQGDGIVIETPEGMVITVDGGSSDVKDLGKYRLAPFLKSRGHGSIHMAFITHADEDHISGMLELIQEGDIRVDSLVLPDTSMRDEAYESIERTAEEKGVRVRYISKGKRIRFGALNIHCLHPEKGYSAGVRNEYSTVLDLTYDKFKLLLTGDLEKEGESLVTEVLRKEKGSYTLLKAAHHGSDTSTGEEFLAEVKPLAAVISCGEENSYGHPHPEVLRRLAQAKSRIYLTKRCGAVMVRTDGRQVWIKGFREISKK